MSVLEMERGLSPLMAPEPEIAGSPEIGQGMVFEVMGYGSVIEKDLSPRPIATIETGDAASTQAVAAVLAELSDRMSGDSAEPGERFRPVTLADLQEEIEKIKAGDRPVTNTSFVKELIESDNLYRPQADDEGRTEAEARGEEPEEEERGKNFLSGLRRSRLGRGVAATAVVATGALAWASSASAGSLKEDCAQDILATPGIVPPPVTGLYHAGKKRQSFDITISLGDVDPACDGNFERLAYFMPYLVRHGHKIIESPIINGKAMWVPFFSREEDGNAPGNAGFTYPRSLADPKFKLWRRGDKPRFKLRLQELNLATNNVVATKITTHRMKIVSHTP